MLVDKDNLRILKFVPNSEWFLDSASVSFVVGHEFRYVALGYITLKNESIHHMLLLEIRACHSRRLRYLADRMDCSRF
jgi:hypothetical protein